VLSYVRLAPRPADLHQVRIEAGQADAVIACDMVVASSRKALDVLKADTTRVVANLAELATADHVLYRDADMQADQRLALLRDAVGEANFATLDANRLAEQLLGDTVFSNVMMLGFAWQQGLLPVSEAALKRAIELNGVAIEKNQRAFAWGRLAAVEPGYLQRRLDDTPLAADASLDEVIDRNARRLTRYQDRAYAERYVAKVARMREAEARLGADESLTRAVATQLYRLMACKDEYEVARLYTESDFLAELEATFGGDYKLTFHLAPPLLAGRRDARGRPVKRRFGPWMLKAMKGLARLRGLRNGPLDPFRFSADRRLDRRLLAEYEALLDELVARLDAGTHATALALARLPEEIRGFGPVREAAAEIAAERRSRLLEELRQGRPVTIAAEAA